MFVSSIAGIDCQRVMRTLFPTLHRYANIWDVFVEVYCCQLFHGALGIDIAMCLVALQKGNGRVRGLVMSDVFRRLVGRSNSQPSSKRRATPFSTPSAPKPEQRASHAPSGSRPSSTPALPCCRSTASALSIMSDASRC